MKPGAGRSNASGGLEQAIAATAGPPPLVAGENAPAYEEMLARVADAVKASDMLEHMWIRDVVDLAWEVFRLRRHKADLMAAARFDGMKALHRSRWGSDGDRFGPDRPREEDRLTRVETELAKTGLTADHVAAYTFAMRIEDFERIERLIAALEVRRNDTLRELDLHRSSLALRLRRALQELEDAEAGVVAPERPAGGHAS